MINFDNAVKENIKEHNPNWPQIPNHPYRILIIVGSRSGKPNSLFNLINQEPDNKVIISCRTHQTSAGNTSICPYYTFRDITVIMTLLQEADIDKIYLHAKDPYEATSTFKRGSTGLNHFNDSKAFVEYLNDVDDIYKRLKSTSQTINIKS